MHQNFGENENQIKSLNPFDDWWTLFDWVLASTTQTLTLLISSSIDQSKSSENSIENFSKKKVKIDVNKRELKWNSDFKIALDKIGLKRTSF